MQILGIDPGPKKSAYCLSTMYQPTEYGKVDNNELVYALTNANITEGFPATAIIEKPVCRKWSGAEVSDTAIQAGVFSAYWPMKTIWMTRQKIKMALVGRKGNDARIRAYLIERFDQDNFKKNKKGIYVDQGSEFFKDFKDDVWQAYALNVVYMDELLGDHSGPVGSYPSPGKVKKGESNGK